jgi:hypothetical protein
VSPAAPAKTATLWRCFPWDKGAAPGDPFSPTYLQPGQTTGRFDLGDRPPVRYLAGSPAHAVGEVLQGFRGAALTAAHLKRHGWPLAIASCDILASACENVADLGDPAVLLTLGHRPGELAHHDRVVTQAIARQVHGDGYAGLRWWSALTGAWNSTVLFADRVLPAELTVGTPEPLTLRSMALTEAAQLLGISL